MLIAGFDVPPVLGWHVANSVKKSHTGVKQYDKKRI